MQAGAGHSAERRQCSGSVVQGTGAGQCMHKRFGPGPFLVCMHGGAGADNEFLDEDSACSELRQTPRWHQDGVQHSGIEGEGFGFESQQQHAGCRQGMRCRRDEEDGRTRAAAPWAGCVWLPPCCGCASLSSFHRWTAKTMLVDLARRDNTTGLESGCCTSTQPSKPIKGQLASDKQQRVAPRLAQSPAAPHHTHMRAQEDARRRPRCSAVHLLRHLLHQQQ